MSKPEKRQIFSGLSDSFYHMDTEASVDDSHLSELEPHTLSAVPPAPNHEHEHEHELKQQIAHPAVSPSNNKKNVDNSTAPESSVYCDVCVIS